MSVIKEEFLVPLVRYLRNDVGIQVLNTMVPEYGVNPILGPPTVLPVESSTVAYSGAFPLWVFRGFEQNGSPFVNVEGTGTSSITLEHTGYWGTPNRGTSAIFPQVTAYYHCDVTRDMSVGGPIAYDAVGKCITIHEAVKKLLHIKDKKTGGYLRVGQDENDENPINIITSVCSREVTTTPVFNGDGMIVGTATFDLELKY